MLGYYILINAVCVLQTLGMIYEEKKMVNKSLQFLLIAAFLSPNAEEWEKLADLSLHQVCRFTCCAYLIVTCEKTLAYIVLSVFLLMYRLALHF